MKNFVRGDIDGFVGLFLDNLIQLLVIMGLCSAVLGFDEKLLLQQVLPGSAVALVIGNVFYAWQAQQLAKREGRDDVCALPYGINTPSVFAYIFLVMLPAKLQAIAEGHPDPSHFAWQMGLVAALGSGVIETLGAFVAEPLRRWVPRAALLSTLAGIALGFISLGFLFKSFEHPEVGLITLGVLSMFYFGKAKMPLGLPGGIVALIVGIVLCWATGLRQWDNMPAFQIQWSTPAPLGLELWQNIFSAHWLSYLGIIFSMGLFNVVGSLQNLESAEAAGDNYPTRPSLAVNGLGTLAGALFGSCFPTTIYIGHPGWKAMGARSGYSTLNAIACTLLCCTASLGFLAWWIPLEAGMAIVIYIGIVISAQAFSSVENRHFPAVVFGLLPGLGAWGIMMAKNGFRVAGGVFDQNLFSNFAKVDVAIAGGLALEQGFILCAMLLSATVVHLIDQKWHKAAFWMFMAAVLSALGIMHSYTLNGADAVFAMEPAWPFVRAYGGCAVVFMGMAWISRKASP
jgi:adenine/guanine/hypoxanthine permease